MDDMNGLLRDRIERVIGSYRVAGESGSDERMRGICTSTFMNVADAYFQHSCPSVWYRYGDDG